MGEIKLKKHIVIIGAGPAGLTAAYEILSKSDDYKVTIFEEEKQVGGISKTIEHNGNRIDIGGHRFFSKDDTIMNWWTSILNIQGQDSFDDKMLNREKNLNENGPDPESEDNVMLIRNRVSRIYYLRKFFDYPISMKIETFLNMGFKRTLKAGFSFIKSTVHKLPEDNLENFIINRFGKQLYTMFFENYTEKVWGKHPAKISASWGKQRIKGLSLLKLVTDIIKKPFIKTSINQKNVETSLITQFLYPKHGPGQLWETVAEKVQKLGVTLNLNSKVTGLISKNNKIQEVIYVSNGKSQHIDCDIVISSMPVKDLIESISDNNISSQVINTAKNLPYRDFITVGLLVTKLEINNTSNQKTLNNIVPDCWIYIQEPDVNIGRLQIFNNWSPYMVKEPLKYVWLGLEYFCNEGDDLWNMDDSKFIDMAKEELEKIGILKKYNIVDSIRINIKKAYPAYFGSYDNFAIIKDYLNTYENLYCVGRNGQHRYNNMDHSMLTAIETVKNITQNIKSKENIWSVNSESEYHEEKSK